MSKEKERSVATREGIKPIKQVEEAELLKIPGVTGVGIGYKIVKGEKTNELSIRVYVAEKKDTKDVPKNELIPKEIKGVKTDVIQRKFVLHPLRLRLQDLEIKLDTGNYDPLKGGISIGPCRSVYLTPPDVNTAGWYVFVGTLGAIVKDNDTNDPMLLSNFHVMCVDNGWSVGDDMTQPSRVDGGNCPANVVGELQRASLGGQVDCAVASHTARGYSCSIVDIGWVAGKATASVGMAVRKRGRTTGLTYGTVDTVNLTVSINYGDGLGTVTLTNQIGIDVDPAKSAQFGDHGDSGSVVVDDNRRVVGLYFAGDSTGSYGVANPIQAVLDALNVRICVPSIVKKREPDIVKAWWSEVEWNKTVERWKDVEKLKEKPKEFDKPEVEKYKGTPERQKLPPELPPREEIPRLPRGGLEDRITRIETAIEGLIPAPEWQKPETSKPELYKPEGYKPEAYKPERYKPEGYKPEGYKPPVIPTERVPSMPRGNLEDRITRLEAVLSQLTHFISPEHRPDLSDSALRNEKDYR
jgi:hypothetical protein